MKNFFRFLIRSFVAVIFCTWAVVCVAQDLEWARKMGGGDNDWTDDVTVDRWGNVYTTGGFTTVADFDPGLGMALLTAASGTAFNRADIFISKLNAAGQYLWAKRIGSIEQDHGLSVITDPAGNVYVAGRFTGTVDFDPGPGIFNLNGHPDASAFVCKLDSAGNFVWAKHIAAGAYATGHVVRLDGQGNVYVGGNFHGSGDFDPGAGVFTLTDHGDGDPFVCKLDANGVFIWAKHWGGPFYDPFTSLDVNPSGNVFATGIFQNYADFDPGPGIVTLYASGYVQSGFQSADGNIYVLHLDAGGNFVWVKNFETTGTGSGGEQVLDIRIDDGGDIYTTGSFSRTVDFDPGTGVYNLSATGRSSIFVAKLSAAGNFIYAKAIGSTNTQYYGFHYGTSLATDLLGNLYVTGRFIGTSDFDPGPGQFNMTSSVDLYDAFLLKLNISGDFIWARQFVNINRTQGRSSGGAVFVDELHSIYLAGDFMHTVDFNPDTPVYNLTSQSGSQDIFVLKFGQECSDTFYTSLTVCDSLVLDTVVYAANGLYTHTFAGRYGCDSVVIFDLHIGKNTDTLIHTACTQFVIDGQVYTESGSYRQVLKNSFGCDSVLYLYLTVVPPVSDTVYARICSGEEYLFQDKILTDPGLYRDTIAASGGCDSVIFLYLEVLPLPSVAVVADRYDEPCLGDSLHLTALGAERYEWYDGEGRLYGNGDRLTFRLLDALSILVSVRGYDAQNCAATAILYTEARSCCDLLLPDAFSPNGDGLNDMFGAVLSGRISSGGYQLEIYNRWGERVFVSNDISRRWDGMYKGVVAEIGTYHYKITAFCVEGTQIQRKGDVTLVR